MDAWRDRQPALFCKCVNRSGIVATASSKNGYGKKKVLESKGYKVGTVEELIGLGSEESGYIELKLSLSEALIRHRKKSNLKQAQ
jgi:rRNA processing protein Gar1